MTEFVFVAFSIPFRVNVRWEIKHAKLDNHFYSSFQMHTFIKVCFIKCEWNSFWQEVVIISMTLFRFFFRVVIDLLVHQTDKVHILSYELLKWIWHSPLKKRQETDAWLGPVLTLCSQIISWSVVIFSCEK